MDLSRRLAVWGYGMLIALLVLVLILVFGGGLTLAMLLPVLLVGAVAIWFSTRTINRRYAAAESERRSRG